MGIPLVSVIIPNYNHVLYLPQRIESVLQQTYPNLEVILLDDCSPDNSREVIECYAAQDSRIRVVFNNQNSGSTFKQWNKGFDTARGKYVWIAESDDYADTRFLEKLVERLEADPKIGLAYCNSNTVDENNVEINALDEFYSVLDATLWTKDFVVDGRELIIGFMSFRNVIPNASAVVIRKSVIDKVGKADENFRINGDWIFWAAIMANTKVAYLAEKLNYFRFHTNNVRSSTLANGVSLHEKTKLLHVIQQYGAPNPVFFDKMIEELMQLWFQGIIANDIPFHTQVRIHSNMRSINKRFYPIFFKYFKKNMLENNLSGMRQFLGDGLLYKILKK
ncbi:glycosyltransferase family 2 protein [Hymenobacter caeli]|uniref:Glycosyltransferase involved in cell wall biosynthesis n=1 Tax=Hymenobacter caeli TaxID=2735894 RepID=A0ABX2FLD5_9BACT|nr:glycosyltransferase family 2 protein [Hymenobacter caeli]NRT17269.1 glycosyltransferase involved in cell wall biosynthesis [Hymenobacter caeli]